MIIRSGPSFGVGRRTPAVSQRRDRFRPRLSALRAGIGHLAGTLAGRRRRYNTVVPGMNVIPVYHISVQRLRLNLPVVARRIDRVAPFRPFAPAVVIVDRLLRTRTVAVSRQNYIRITVRILGADGGVIQISS